MNIIFRNIFTALTILIAAGCYNDSEKSNNTDWDNYNVSKLAFKKLFNERQTSFSVGKISNLDSLNGFRNLKLGLNKKAFDLNAFSSHINIENPYGIEFYEINTEVPFDSKEFNMRFILSFIKDTLSQFTITYSRNFGDLLKNSGYFPIDLNDLEIVFSKHTNYEYKSKGELPVTRYKYTSYSVPEITFYTYYWDSKKLRLKYSLIDSYSVLGDDTYATKTYSQFELSYTLRNKINTYDKYDAFLNQKYIDEENSKIINEKKEKSKKF